MQIHIPKISKSNRFKPGYNIALGKDIRSSKEYVDELKKQGLEPYDKNSKMSEQKTYKPSKRCHEMTEYIRKHTDKNGKVKLSGKMMAEIGAYLPQRSK